MGLVLANIGSNLGSKCETLHKNRRSTELALLTLVSQPLAGQALEKTDREGGKVTAAGSLLHGLAKSAV